MKELSGVDRAIVGTLEGDSTLATLAGGSLDVWTDAIPQDAPYPCIVVSLLAAPNTVSQGGDTVMQRPLLLVKAVGQTTVYTDLEPLIWRAVSLLDRQKFEVDLGDGSVWVTLHRDQGGTVRYPETGPGGVQYRHLGERFRAFAYVLPGLG